MVMPIRGWSGGNGLRPCRIKTFQTLLGRPLATKRPHPSMPGFRWRPASKRSATASPTEKNAHLGLPTPDQTQRAPNYPGRHPQYPTPHANEL
jgi:hypothetical protein